MAELSKQTYRLATGEILTITDHNAEDPTSKVTPPYRYLAKVEMRTATIIASGGTSSDSLKALARMFRTLANEIDSVGDR